MGQVRAVVFDFFGTLTDPAAEAGRQAAFARTAAVLRVPADTFATVMSGCFAERVTGVYGDTRTTLQTLARRCGAEPTERDLDEAVAVHRAGAVLLRRPRRGVLGVLDALRARGFRLGVLSDCGSELAESWPRTPYAARFDATVFSWREGYRKPDPRLYATAADRLRVPARQCWYVGDGGSREHAGARSAGMRPVLVTNAGCPGAAAWRDDPDPYRPDLVVDEVAELLSLVGTVPPAGRPPGT